MNLKKAKALCATFPDATEDTKWDNARVFSINRKMFAVFWVDANGALKAMWFPAGPERFLELTDQPGFAPAPYLARASWVSVKELRLVSDRHAGELLGRSYRIIVARQSKKAQRVLQEKYPQFDFALEDGDH